MKPKSHICFLRFRKLRSTFVCNVLVYGFGKPSRLQQGIATVDFSHLMRDERRHIPVLETTVLDLLDPKPGDDVLDVTLGLAGHAKRFLEKTAPDGHVTGLDADEENLRASREHLQEFASRTTLVHANFGDIASLGLQPFDIVFADLGVSSPHFDDPERGMSFRGDGPLDLRYDRASGESASSLIERTTEKDLALMFGRFGELRGVYRLAAIVKRRLPKTTQEMRACVEEAYAWKAPQVMAQVFQALRIWVNDELGALERLLAHLPSLMKPNARAGIISYHSLEDRLVKHAMRTLITPEKDPVTGRVTQQPAFELPLPKGVQPSLEESKVNPRARSARLRILHRLP